MNGPCNRNVGPCNPNVGSWYFQWYFETWKTVERAVRGIVRYRNKGLICQSDAVLSGQIVKGGSSKQNVNIFWRSCQNSPSFSSLGCDSVMIVGAGVIVFSRRFRNWNSDERTSKRCSATYERKRTCLWKSRWFHICEGYQNYCIMVLKQMPKLQSPPTSFRGWYQRHILWWRSRRLFFCRFSWSWRPRGPRRWRNSYRYCPLARYEAQHDSCDL